jgi:uncharacterized protein
MILNMLTSNYLINIGVTSWITAQLIKTLAFYIKNKTMDFKTLSGSGGMPSAHSALVCSVAIGTAHRYGFHSPYFSLALTLAMIVMYDAMGVRRAAGEQAKAINEIQEYLRKTQCKLPDTIKYSPIHELNESLGHKPSEVFGGALLGACVAFTSIVWFH